MIAFNIFGNSLVYSWDTNLMLKIITTMRNHLILLGRAIIKKSTNNKMLKRWEKKELSYTVGRNVNCILMSIKALHA